LQPSAFGVLLLLSMALFLRKRPLWAVLSAVLAATIHPTYLLSAASLTLAYMLVRFKESVPEKPSDAGFFAGHRWRQPVLIGGVALLAVAPILLYTYTSFAQGGEQSTAQTAAQAREILVHYRIPHHAVIEWWFDATAVIKIAMVAAGIALARKSRLFLILLVPALIAGGLTLVQWFLQSDVLALIFPWRLSTWLVPVSMSLILAFLVTWSLERFPELSEHYAGWVQALSLGLIAIAVLVGALRLVLDFERKHQQPESPVMAYIAAHPHAGAVYLAPVKMQDFRLAAGAPMYVDFKAIPYRDTDVLEWYQRIQKTNQFFKEGDCEVLEEIVAQSEKTTNTAGGAARVTHVVLPAELYGHCPQLQPLYQDKNYGVFIILPTASTSSNG
jgi:hypothetical protein